MIRDPPSQTLMRHILGSSEWLAPISHHGLVETPFEGISSHLDLDEILVTPADFYELRRKQDPGFMARVESANLYEIFHYAHSHGSGFQSLNANRRIPNKFKGAYARQNPFGRRHNLRERLGAAELANPEAVGELREKLKAPAKTYVRQKDYDFAADKANLAPLPNQFITGDSTTKSIAYSKEIAKILSQYPRAYEPVPEPAAPQLSFRFRHV